MYVNHYTVDCGEIIPKAAQKLLDLGFEAGIIPVRIEARVYPLSAAARAPLLGAPAAVDHHVRAGDEAGFFRAQVQAPACPPLPPCPSAPGGSARRKSDPVRGSQAAGYSSRWRRGPGLMALTVMPAGASSSARAPRQAQQAGFAGAVTPSAGAARCGS